MFTKKNGIAVLFLYLLQFTIACDPCDCPTPSTYERTYNDVLVKAWDTSGFQTKEVDGKVNKNAFGLTISVEFELEKIAHHKTHNSFGFGSAIACSCSSDKYINVDPIVSIEILVTNRDTNEINTVTDLFKTNGYYNDKPITLTELFKNKEEWRDGFQLDLVAYETIPDNSIFTVKAFLKSGIMLSKQTKEINFY